MLIPELRSSESMVLKRGRVNQRRGRKGTCGGDLTDDGTLNRNAQEPGPYKYRMNRHASPLRRAKTGGLSPPALLPVESARPDGIVATLLLAGIHPYPTGPLKVQRPDHLSAFASCMLGTPS